jgi:hypothetical protein
MSAKTKRKVRGKVKSYHYEIHTAPDSEWTFEWKNIKGGARFTTSMTFDVPAKKAKRGKA